MAESRRQVSEGTLLWEPSRELVEQSNIGRFMRWLAENRGHQFASYDELWQWSVEDLEAFWSAVWDYFEVIAHAPYTRVLAPSPKEPESKARAGSRVPS
jgi:acetoacetyl-CoA synthetase